MNILQTPVNTVVSTRKKQWGKVILCYTELQCVCFRNFYWSRLNPGKHETAAVSGGECEGIVGNDSHLRIDSAAAAKSLQSCPTVRPPRRQPTRLPCPRDSPGKTLEWVAISFSKAWKWKVKVKLLSPVWLFATPWTAAHQAPPFMGFSRQESWSGAPLPSPEDRWEPALS